MFSSKAASGKIIIRSFLRLHRLSFHTKWWICFTFIQDFNANEHHRDELSPFWHEKIHFTVSSLKLCSVIHNCRSAAEEKWKPQTSHKFFRRGCTIIRLISLAWIIIVPQSFSFKTRLKVPLACRSFTLDYYREIKHSSTSQLKCTPLEALNCTRFVFGAIHDKCFRIYEH